MGSGQRSALRSIFRRWWPELVVTVLAGFILLGFLGSLELWGKREQRAAAETLDTVENGRWLVAQIQGRPRLEKPPLPRWTTALFMTITGGRDEWTVRLPCAIAGLATVFLVYRLGAKIGGRSLALASSMALCSMWLFITELRQAGNDGPLGLFTTLSLYAAWCRLHGTRRDGWEAAGNLRTKFAGPRSYALLFYLALGLGFLCKGPVILLLVGLTIVPYLTVVKSLGPGLRRLADPAGFLIFAGLALSWPVPVWLRDSNAVGVWLNEMGQKTGILPISHQSRSVLGLELPVLVLPWPVAVLAGSLLPFVRKQRDRLPWHPRAIWFPWCWTVVNLAMFSVWAVAKPNYFLPCLPGTALLVGMTWIRLSRAARGGARSAWSLVARGLLGLQWSMILIAGVLTPLLCRQYLTAPNPIAIAAIALAATTGVGLSLSIWRRGSNVLALAPITGACAVGVLLGYGIVGPSDNAARGHRALATGLERCAHTISEPVYFFHEIDEGLWFYLGSRRLAPLPGSQPRYSDSFDKVAGLLRTRGPLGAANEPSLRLFDQHKAGLIFWLESHRLDEPLLLIRGTLYDRFARDLTGLARPVLQEYGLKRNSLVLLQACGPHRLTALPR